MARFLPSIVSVRMALKGVREEIRTERECVDGIDVRLQVYPDGSWAIRVGPSDYDLDHRGFWGAASVSPTDKVKDLDDTARSLLDQVVEHKETSAWIQEARDEARRW